MADAVRIIHAVDPLVIVHVAAASLLVAIALVVGAWGIARSRSIAASDHPRESRAFAQILQLSHTLILAVGLIGLALLLEGHRNDDPLHARVYGPFMVIAVIAAYGYRTKVARTNVVVFAVASLVVAALGVRAFYTG